MSEIIKTVYDFNHQVVGVSIDSPRMLDRDQKLWLQKALNEEAQELTDAPTLEDQVDALIDSAIFALGGLCRLGITPEAAEACFHVVMDANFQKKAGQKKGRVVGKVKDAIKPEDWLGPEERIRTIILPHFSGNENDKTK